jgi:DNA-binding MarR family transcriptional regulator
MNGQGREDAVTLEILATIEEREDMSQRHLADRLGVALGLANLYLKRCVRKGLVKITQAPANRYLYYLTPKGFAEKSRLTAEYLSVSFNFYRQAGESCVTAFRQCAEQGRTKVLLGGLSELGEIASMRAEEQGIHIIGTIDPATDRQTFAGHPVWCRFEEVPPFDACLLTALGNGPAMYEFLTAVIEQDRIMVPDVLGMNGNAARGGRKESRRKTRR